MPLFPAPTVGEVAHKARSLFMGMLTTTVAAGLVQNERKVYSHCILPVLTYGSETWRLTKELERKLRRAQRGMERKRLGITWRDEKQASWIREQTKIEDILMTIKKKEWTNHA